MRALIRGLVSVLLACGAAVGAAGGARAADTHWVPPSWVQVDAGDSVGARSALGGGDGGVSGEPGLLTLGAWPDPLATNYYGFAKWTVEVAGLNAAGLPIMRLVRPECQAGDLADACGQWTSYFDSWNVDPNKFGLIWAECAEGGRYPASPSGEAHSLMESSSQCTPTRFYHDPYGSGWLNVQGWSVTVDGDLELFTSTLTCRDSSGADSDVVQSATGAPPVLGCGGGAAVRLQVWSSLRGLIQDIVLIGNWDDWWRYIRGEPGPVVEAPEGDCYLVTSVGAWQLTERDCLAAGEEGVLTPADPEDDASDPDDNILVRAIRTMSSTLNKALKTIKTVLDGVRSGVNRVVSGITGLPERIARALQSDLNGIGDAVEPLDDGIDRVREAVEDGFAGLRGLFGDYFTCTTGKCTGIGEGLGTGVGAGQRDVVDDWVSLYGDYAAALAPNCGCGGVGLDLPNVGHFVLVDSCGGYVAQAAAFSRLGSRVLIVVGALAASLRFISAAFSFTSLMGYVRDKSGGE